MHMEAYSHKEADRGAIVSIAAYIFLSAVKLIVSYITASSALRADGLNNLTDIGASLAILIGLKISRKPRDHNHPYGHSRAEQVASLAASFIMASVGINVMIDSVRLFFQKEQTTPSITAAWVAVFCAVVMYGVYVYNTVLARRTKSKALEAAAKDNFSDMLVSIGTTVGIIGSQYSVPVLDPIAALIVGIIIVKTAWDIFKDASHLLTDGIDPYEMELYKHTVAMVNGVNKITDIRGRMYGNEAYVDITIEVNATMDVIESHRITDEIEELLKQEHQILHSHIHVEPSKTKIYTSLK